MILFLGGLALLVAGYFTYGRLVERIVGPDDRKTPAGFFTVTASPETPFTEKGLGE